MSTEKPTITIITSVYNGEEFLAETIDSILNQTFTDFEYLLYDNCSQDHTVDIIKAYAAIDSRIKLYVNEVNIGQYPNLNRAIEESSGKYIAVTDADDISYPDRLQIQYQLMESDSEIIMCGSCADYLENGTLKKPSSRIEYTEEELRFALPFRNPIAHSSFMFRSKTLKKTGLRYGKQRFCADYGMILNALKYGRVVFTKDALIKYRISDQQMSQKFSNDLKTNESKELSNTYLKSNAGDDADILCRAVISREKMCASEWRNLQNGLINYAIKCGVAKSKKEAEQNSLVREVMNEMMFSQPRSLQWALFYCFSPLLSFTQYLLMQLKKLNRRYKYDS